MSTECDMIDPKVIAITDLGPGNKGNIKNTLNSEQTDDVLNALSSSEMLDSPSATIGCVDGRLSDISEKEGPTLQVAGGIPVVESAADMMVNPRQHMPLSKTVELNTRSAVSDGYKILIHGDETAGMSGCGANKHLRDTLKYNKDNAATVVPTAKFLCDELVLGDFVTEQDLHTLVTNGSKNAERNELWDVGPEEVVNIALNNGAKYEKMEGAHKEKAILVLASSATFDKKKFVKQKSVEIGQPCQAFAVSLGAYRDMIFSRMKTKSISEKDIAKRVAAAVLFNIGVPKILTADNSSNNEALPVIVVG